MENEAENENNATSDSDDGPALDLETLEALDLERDELRRLQLEMIDQPDDDDELPEAPPALQAPALPIDRRPQVTEGGRFRPSDVACAKRQTNWRVWVIGRSGERPESPGIAIVSPGIARNRGCTAALSPGMAAVICRHALNCILPRFRKSFIEI